MKCQGLAWCHVWLSAIASICLGQGGSVEVPGQNSCIHSGLDDNSQDGSALSLLQTATAAWRSMPARAASSRLDMAGAEGNAGLVENRASKHQQQYRKQQERGLVQNHALRYMFPMSTSSPQQVQEFFVAFGEDATATRMFSEHVDGHTFLDMNMDDLEQYGIDQYHAQIILDRMEIARSQSSLRKSIIDMATKGSHYTGVKALHDIVGADGVFMISLDRKGERFNYSSRVLRQIGVNPVKISAVDAEASSAEELAGGCPKLNGPGVKEWCQKPASRPEGRAGFGCMWPSEQAVAASHRKALEKAKERNGEWTAILEDDAVPAPVENWNIAFRELWKQLPSQVKLVRLGWCRINTMDWSEPIIEVQHANTSGADLIQKEGCCGTMLYDPGGCTTAYMVHRDILDEMLNLFPCCGPVDSCYKWDYFRAYNPLTKNERGLDIMMSMDSQTPPLWDGNVEHHGMFVQDRATIESAQEIPWGTFDIPSGA
mmetsp:Transcript_64538/g.118859  ORF Transcript_64538/g.118859 Transcript_64538/m.118859 type:complete len:486 (+) Transcript_64538:69-1526(+)